MAMAFFFMVAWSLDPEKKKTNGKEKKQSRRDRSRNHPAATFKIASHNHARNNQDSHSAPSQADRIRHLIRGLRLRRALSFAISKIARTSEVTPDQLVA